jgi:hypothetical protein
MNIITPSRGHRSRDRTYLTPCDDRTLAEGFVHKALNVARDSQLFSLHNLYFAFYPKHWTFCHK